MLRKLTLGASLLAMGGSWVLAQQAERDEEIVRPPVGVFQPPQADPQAEMLELFRSVERRMRQIDELLSDAGAGETAQLDRVSESGVSNLLKRSRESSVRTVEEIDRILKLIESTPP